MPNQKLFAALPAARSVVWLVVHWVCFKLMQGCVGLVFTLIIEATTGLAGVIKLIWPPKAAQKVAAARAAQSAREAAPASADPSGAMQDLAESSCSETDSEAQEPFHVFTDPAKGQ
jgi:hypothetical protein